MMTVGEIVGLMMMVGEIVRLMKAGLLEKGTGEGTRRHLFHSCIFTYHTSCLHEKNKCYILATGYGKCVCISEGGKRVFQSGKMKVEVLPTERALLAFLLAKIHKLDPDLIVVSSLQLFTFDSHKIEIKPSHGYDSLQLLCLFLCVFSFSVIMQELSDFAWLKSLQ